MMNQLVARQMRDTSVYFAFKRPAELGSYHWVLHAKNENPTPYEEIWGNLIAGFLQTESFSRHIHLTVDGGDYSYFERFCKKLDKWPDHLPNRISGAPREAPAEIVDISLIMNESFTVEDAVSVPGLRMADICINAFRRAVVGNLKRTGWHDLGKLMLYLDANPVVVVRIDLSHETPMSSGGEPLAATIERITSGAECIVPT
jgi:hypothetical protein